MYGILGTWETIEPGGYPLFEGANPPEIESFGYGRKKGVANDDYIF